MAKCIDELTAFSTWKLSRKLSSTGVSVWFALAMKWYACGCKNPFTATLSELQAVSETSKNTFYKKRDELRDAGLILYEEQGANRATLYTMISVVELLDRIQKAEVMRCDPTSTN